MTDHLHCYACERRIRESADDMVLANRRTGELRFYHLASPCRDVADKSYFALKARDRDWHISERYAVWSWEIGEGLEA